MSEVPRDPRQLARDILSGKVRIEDLAKQRGMPPPQRPQARVPDKIPLPRQMPAPPRPAPAPPRAAVPRAVSRPAPQQAVRRQPPPVRAVPPPIRPLPPQPVVRPASAVPASAYALRAQAPSTMSIAPKAPETMASALATKTKPVHEMNTLAQLMRGKDALRNGILWSEVLGKPLSLRDL